MESPFRFGCLPAMVHPSRKTVWLLFNCCAVFWILLSTVHWFQLLLCVWALFLCAGKCACYYPLAMVTGERCTIVFLPEKLEKHILKSGLCNEGICNEGSTQLFIFFNFKTSWKNDPKKKMKQKRFSISYLVRSCVCVPFQQGSQVIIT